MRTKTFTIVACFAAGLVLGYLGERAFRNDFLPLSDRANVQEDNSGDEESLEPMSGGTEAPSGKMPKNMSPSAAKQTPKAVVSSARLTTVTYTDRGFEPGVVEVRKGTDIRFVNMSSKAMQIRTYAYFDKNIPLGEYSQDSSAGKGKDFVFGVTATGTFPYYNLNNPGDRGVFFVR